MPDILTLGDKQIAFGGSIKAVEIDTNAFVEGYLVYFTDEHETDLYNEFFDAKTDFVNSPVKLVHGSVMYQHALDKTIGPRDIGEFTEVKTDDIGIWVQAQLDMHDEYQREIFKLAKKGVLSWSSGALPQSVEVEENGHIKRWKIIEGSLTPTPAMPKRTVISAKTYTQMIKDANGHEDHAVSVEADTTQSLNDNPEKATDMNEEVMAILRQILAAVTQDTAMDAAEESTALAAMTDEVLPDDEQKALLDPEKDEQKSIDVTKRLMEKAAAAVNAKRVARNTVIAAAKNRALAPAKSDSRTAHVGAVTPADTTKRGFIGGLQVGENLKFAHMSASDMVFTALLMGSELKEGAFKRATLDGIGLSEDFIVHMKHKTSHKLTSEGLGSSKDTIAVKSVMPWRANEIDSTTNTGFGLEWVSTFWGSEVWLKARAQVVYQAMIAKGMQEYEVPQGAGSLKVPTEAADPTVYAVQQNNDLGADLRPPVLATPTPFGTGNVTLTPALLMAISYYTNMLEEDSIIPIAAQLNYQMQKKMAETIEQAIINGDAVTTANTNLNLIDGTPATGTARPYYLNNNGILKYPIITNTALSRSAGGGYNLQDFRLTLNLFSPEFGTNKQNMFWLMDYYTEVTALGFPEFATEDVAGRYATIQNGQVLKVYNIDNIVSGYIVKANSAGKVPAAGGTLGRMALVYAPYWALGYKRDVRLETGYYVEAQTKSLVASTRFDIIARGAQAAAATVNIGLS